MNLSDLTTYDSARCTAEQLRYELEINPPEWIFAAPAPHVPCLVSEMESLRAIALV
jgi:hypothetical protein